VQDRDTFRYVISRSHPVLLELSEDIDDDQRPLLEALLRLVESTFPTQDMFNRMATDEVSHQTEVNPQVLREILSTLWQQRRDPKPSASDFVARMLTVEPLDELRGQREELIHWLETDWMD
jgi:hypothetical protein